MPPKAKIRKYSAVFCPRCDRQVSKLTWYSHHRNYFDKSRGHWRKMTTQPRPSFNFADEESIASSISDEDCSEAGGFSSPEDTDQRDNVSSSE